MTFKPKTIEYISEIGTFQMLPGRPFKINPISNVLIEKDLLDCALGNCFLIVEGYLYSFAPNGESDLADYLNARTSLNLLERLELFGLMVDFDRNDLIIKAYVDTRDKVLDETSENGDKKKSILTRQEEA